MLSQRSFRDVLGRFATGVVLLTARTDRGPVGMTANSFISISLDPPLVGLCVARTSLTWPSVRTVGAFAISILSSDHEELCRIFAARDMDRFTGRPWEQTPAGHPRVPDGVGWIDCDIETTHPAGDHELVIARATCWSVAQDRSPLIFHSGCFTRLTS